LLPWSGVGGGALFGRPSHPLLVLGGSPSLHYSDRPYPPSAPPPPLEPSAAPLLYSSPPLPNASQSSTMDGPHSSSRAFGRTAPLVSSRCKLGGWRAGPMPRRSSAEKGANKRDPLINERERGREFSGMAVDDIWVPLIVFFKSHSCPTKQSCFSHSCFSKVAFPHPTTHITFSKPLNQAHL